MGKYMVVYRRIGGDLAAHIFDARDGNPAAAKSRYVQDADDPVVARSRAGRIAKDSDLVVLLSVSDCARTVYIRRRMATERKGLLYRDRRPSWGWTSLGGVQAAYPDVYDLCATYLRRF